MSSKIFGLSQNDNQRGRLLQFFSLACLMSAFASLDTRDISFLNQLGGDAMSAGARTSIIHDLKQSASVLFEFQMDSYITDGSATRPNDPRTSFFLQIAHDISQSILEFFGITLTQRRLLLGSTLGYPRLVKNIFPDADIIFLDVSLLDTGSYVKSLFLQLVRQLVPTPFPAPYSMGWDYADFYPEWRKVSGRAGGADIVRASKHIHPPPLANSLALAIRRYDEKLADMKALASDVLAPARQELEQQKEALAAEKSALEKEKEEIAEIKTALKRTREELDDRYSGVNTKIRGLSGQLMESSSRLNLLQNREFQVFAPPTFKDAPTLPATEAQKENWWNDGFKAGRKAAIGRETMAAEYQRVREESAMMKGVDRKTKIEASVVAAEAMGKVIANPLGLAGGNVEVVDRATSGFHDACEFTTLGSKDYVSEMPKIEFTKKDKKHIKLPAWLVMFTAYGVGASMMKRRHIRTIKNFSDFWGKFLKTEQKIALEIITVAACFIIDNRYPTVPNTFGSTKSNNGEARKKKEDDWVRYVHSLLHGFGVDVADMQSKQLKSGMPRIFSPDVINNIIHFCGNLIPCTTPEMFVRLERAAKKNVEDKPIPRHGRIVFSHFKPEEFQTGTIDWIKGPEPVGVPLQPF